MKIRTAALLPVLVLLLIVQAGATVVTSMPTGTVVPMPVVNVVGAGPEDLGGGITWTSANDGSVYGYTDLYGQYCFNTNGCWDGTLGPMAGLNSSFDVNGSTWAMTFAFSTPVAGVGGFLNYSPGGSTPTTIAVFDSTDTLIESYDLIFTTDGSDNTGAFYGFLEASPTISYFRLTDNFVGITDLTILASDSEVPEPGSLLLLGGGALVLIGGLRRRRRA